MSFSTITIAGQTITLVDLPAKPGLKSIEWDYFDQVGNVRSIFTGQQQRQKWPGADRLSGVANLPPLDIAQADDWEPFQMQLRGIANAFLLGDPLRTRPRGSGDAFGNVPIVDNTQPGGNAAGSETVATKGWIANTQVLRRGDWMQIGYRLYRTLDDVTSDGSGNAIVPIWPTLREQPSSDGSSSRYLNPTAVIAMGRSRPLEAGVNGALWSNFSTPALPVDAVIQGIFPVIIASATHDQAFSYYKFGPAMTLGDPVAGQAFAVPSDPGSTTFASTEWYFVTPSGGSTTYGIGTSLSLLTGQEIMAFLTQSLFLDGMADAIAVTGCGFAVYYTSATPITDPQMPPPFTVPSGQGVAWSLPFTVESTGTTSTGSTVATPTLDNGTIILDNTRGLFCLSSNKRTSSVDTGRLARTSFPFEEYR